MCRNLIISALHTPCQMQVRTWPCGHVSCVCGVVIREKNDVIRVDECDQPYAGHHTSPKVEVYSKPLREGTVIQRSTDGHEVTVSKSLSSTTIANVINKNVINQSLLSIN